MGLTSEGRKRSCGTVRRYRPRKLHACGHPDGLLITSPSVVQAESLLKVCAPTAKSVVILADLDISADESDAKVMRTVVALSAFPKLAGHIVAEVRDVDNVENVRLVARHPIECVVANDTIGRMMINCARQPALASVLESLLGFEGDEFYLRAWPDLVGRSFHSIFLEDTLEGAVPIGLRKRNGSIILIPGPDELVDDHDEVLVLSRLGLGESRLSSVRMSPGDCDCRGRRHVRPAGDSTRPQRHHHHPARCAEMRPRCSRDATASEAREGKRAGAT